MLCIIYALYKVKCIHCENTVCHMILTVTKHFPSSLKLMSNYRQMQSLMRSLIRIQLVISDLCHWWNHLQNDLREKNNEAVIKLGLSVWFTIMCWSMSYCFILPVKSSYHLYLGLNIVFLAFALHCIDSPVN